MPEIEIRHAISSDIPALVAIDHSYTSDYVWQMEIQQNNGQILAKFREIHLPRSVRVDYPRPFRKLVDEWTHRSGLLVAVHNGKAAGYASIMLNIAPVTSWVTDLVINRRMRRQGIGSALVFAAEEWGRNHECRSLVLEMQPKNHPAINMAHKLGFGFCGFNDRYYENHDIGLFFTKSII